MLGEQIYVGQGARTGRRAIGTQSVTIEVSFEDAGKLLGKEGGNIGTYVSTPRPDGSIEGTGQGVFASADGSIVSWKGIGVGHFREGGAVSYRGCLVFGTSSPGFARLNDVAGVFEFEVDAAGKTQTRMWEWK
jgi:hypothetical protein